MKATIALLLLFGSSGPIVGEPIKGEVELAKIPAVSVREPSEFCFDSTTEPALWSRQRPGLHAVFGSTDELYLRCEPPGLKDDAQNWQGTGWRGERVNAQIVIWSGTSQEQVRLEAGDLEDGRGHVLKKEQIQARLVRYVLSNLPYQAKGFSCDVSNQAGYLMPDRLEPFESFDLPGRTVRPIWLSVEIPASARPGDYRGSIQVQSSKEQQRLQILVHVQPRLLPKPGDWKFRLDLWQNAWVVASQFRVAPWAEEHKMLLRKHLKLYAEAGGKCITTYMVHSPWADNSYIPEGTMIDWIRTGTGSWRFDYSIFDQYVRLAMEAGIDQAITLYTPIPWGQRVRFLDENSNTYVYERWPVKSERFKAFWNVFLTDLKGHLRNKGWFQKSYIGINENPLDVTLEVAKLIKHHSKDWKIAYAGDWHPELSSLVDDYSAIITHPPSTKELRERAHQGVTTTFYVCCTPPQPNNFVFSSPAEGRYLGWYTAAYGYSGFLRWAYDAWPADPTRDARHARWPAGDCFLVYPGGNSSIRFEKLRQGIVDYEKIRLLRDLSGHSSNKKVKDQMEKLEHHLGRFREDLDFATHEHDASELIDAIQKGRTLVEALSEEVGP